MQAKKRLSILLLVVWMPLYVVIAVSAMNWAEGRFGRMPFLAELLVYVALGVLWILPFRRVFTGVGR